MTRILFVCSGNICRSPTAEGLMRHLVRERGLDDEIEVDAAGTGSWHVGQPPDDRARATAAEHGVELTGRARRITEDDFTDSDLILAVDEVNLRLLREITPPGATADVRMLDEVDVPDPYYGGPDGFEHVYRQVERACRRLLDELVAP